LMPVHVFPHPFINVQVLGLKPVKYVAPLRDVKVEAGQMLPTRH
jgi:hypothetical protein